MQVLAPIPTPTLTFIFFDFTLHLRFAGTTRHTTPSTGVLSQRSPRLHVRVKHRVDAGRRIRCRVCTVGGWVAVPTVERWGRFVLELCAKYDLLSRVCCVWHQQQYVGNRNVLMHRNRRILSMYLIDACKRATRNKKKKKRRKRG
jgi:hypothetical protein